MIKKQQQREKKKNWKNKMMNKILAFIQKSSGSCRPTHSLTQTHRLLTGPPYRIRSLLLSLSLVPPLPPLTKWIISIWTRICQPTTITRVVVHIHIYKFLDCYKVVINLCMLCFYYLWAAPCKRQPWITTTIRIRCLSPSLLLPLFHFNQLDFHIFFSLCAFECLCCAFLFLILCFVAHTQFLFFSYSVRR